MCVVDDIDNHIVIIYQLLAKSTSLHDWSLLLHHFASIVLIADSLKELKAKWSIWNRIY